MNSNIFIINSLSISINLEKSMNSLSIFPANSKIKSFLTLTSLGRFKTNEKNYKFMSLNFFFSSFQPSYLNSIKNIKKWRKWKIKTHNLYFWCFKQQEKKLYNKRIIFKWGKHMLEMGGLEVSSSWIFIQSSFNSFCSFLK